MKFVFEHSKVMNKRNSVVALRRRRVHRCKPGTIFLFSCTYDLGIF